MSMFDEKQLTIIIGYFIPNDSYKFSQFNNQAVKNKESINYREITVRIKYSFSIYHYQ